MIIARSPLRISLGGGGTDLPSYYEKFGGFLIAAAIDRYVYITLHDTFVADLIVKYSELERVPDAAKLKHPIIREAFALVGLDGHSLELTSMADIPSGTGLGSSGSFTTALLKALHAHSLSSQLLENQHLFWGSVSWHYGITLILAAHVLPWLFPRAAAAVLGDPTRLFVLELAGLAMGSCL